MSKREEWAKEFKRLEEEIAKRGAPEGAFSELGIRNREMSMAFVKGKIEGWDLGCAQGRKDEREEKKTLNCYLDGNALCIVKDDFVDIQESDCVFLGLSVQDLKALEKMEKENKKESLDFHQRLAKYSLSLNKHLKKIRGIA